MHPAFQLIASSSNMQGMRQDCTVQHIRGELAARVYEAHARAALEYGDVAEFNQCQAQLHLLYGEGVAGCRDEFLAYRLLYQSLHARRGEKVQLMRSLKQVTAQDARAGPVHHALRARQAMAALDAGTFFGLYTSAPALCRALLDMGITHVRFEFLNAAVRSFKPTIDVPFLAALLGFVKRSGAGAVSPPKPRGPSQPLPGCSTLVYKGKHAPTVGFVRPKHTTHLLLSQRSTNLFVLVPAGTH